ncbi:MAG: Crp/Fnr family transcriptional regulator [Paludibacteraceae bacterium]|nr:Crp/Fnr family transcriptional regulator [Candidatus Colicola coprequi]MCQ2333600.1 Crp/Fnr family transcriptional regulator [Paludibacteraceae bacterium]
MKISSESRLKLWEVNPIWDLLTPEEKMFIHSEVEVVRYSKNEIIHHEGDAPTHTMILMEGKVRIYKEGVGQRQQIIRMLKPYDHFSCYAILGNYTYNSCASALDNCTIYRINKEAFLQIIQSNNQFCFQMLVQMAKDLAIAELQTVNLTQKHIRGRLAESLLTLRDKYGMDEDEATISMYLSREDLANMSNMTTSNAIRTLSQFVSEGLISVDGRKIKILNEEELHRVCRLG